MQPGCTSPPPPMARTLESLHFFRHNGRFPLRPHVAVDLAVRHIARELSIREGQGGDAGC